jgi:vitellogenic carboxypeptidase-like protein
MRASLLLVLALFVLLSLTSARLQPHATTPVRPRHLHDSLSSTPVYLNDFTSPDAAQAATRVNLPGAPESYAGYATVNTTCSSNLFWWFFPSQDGNSSAPVLMWLNGGPGSTSMYGLFEEMGPFNVAADGKTLIPRNTTWNLHYAMLFVDNPVGTGFSYTEDAACYSQNMDDVSVNLYSLLTTFFTAFPSYLPNDFYITGESYAGKYVPSISYYIHQQNLMNPPTRINLVGLSIGDGLMDPLTQVPGYGQLH